MSKKITVGMSGGVDSSVCVFLLQQQGYTVNGVFMKNWQDQDDEFCTSKSDSIDAISVADILGIDINIVNFSKEYQDRVFKYFLEEYKAGRTPNPDVFCNQEIKFKSFLDYAIENGADSIATGHYAIKEVKDGIHFLKKALDENKDQTYFLYRLKPEQLRKSIFPLGTYQKSEIRKIAQQIKLPVYNKKDSTGICFVGERPFMEFLSKYIKKKPGAIVSEDGEILGEHQGLSFYTIGQRKGLGIGGRGLPWFVADKNLDKNELIVVQGHNHPLLFSKEIIINNLSFTLPYDINNGIFRVKTRYRMKECKCLVERISDDYLRIIFDEPLWAVTLGQSAVLYDNDICIGGGIIANIVE